MLPAAHSPSKTPLQVSVHFNSLKTPENYPSTETTPFKKSCLFSAVSHMDLAATVYIVYIYIYIYINDNLQRVLALSIYITCVYLL